MLSAIIDAFDFPEVHEVVGFGRIAIPSGTASEFRVEIVFAKVVDTMTYGLGLDPLVRLIGCGQLDATPIGSRWLEGRKVGQRLYRHRVVGRVFWRGNGKLGDYVATTKPSGLFLAGEMPCYLLKLESADLKSKWVVVPIAEVIRVLFGTTSHFLVQLIGGLRDPRLAPDSAFYDRGLSGRIDADGFRLACTRNPTDMEAVLAAWILADEQMRWPHDSVCQSRVVGFDGLGYGPFTMAFPKPAAESPWTFEGRYLASKATVDAEGVVQKRPDTFLVTRIFIIPIAPPFRRLEIAMHVLRSTKDGPPTKRRVVIMPGSPIPRMRNQAPGSGRALLAVTTDGVDLQPAHHIDIIRLPGQPGGAPSPLILMGDRRESVDGSTGDRRSGGDEGTMPVVFRRSRDAPSSLGVSIDQRILSREATYVAVVGIAIDHGWAIVKGGREPNGDVLLETVNVGERSFPMLLVCIRTPAGDVFVADAGTKDGNQRSLGLLVRKDRLHFDASRDVTAICEHAALTGARWRARAALKGFNLIGLSRQPAGIWRLAAAYTDQILEGLVELLI